MQRIGVLCSGGDSPGMNAAVRAVARACAYEQVTCYGIHNGYQGMIEGQIVPLTPRDVSGIIDRGGTILGSARSAAFRETEGRRRAAAMLQEHGIDGIVVVGGDGSYRGAQQLHEEHGIKCIGLPGTIDNDIGGTDFTIGFDTAMNTAMEAIDRLRDTAESHGRLFFVEAMGRHSGYLAMIAGIAGGAEIILVPEEPTDLPGLVEQLRECRRHGKRSIIVVVAEGDDAGSAIEVARHVAENSEFTDTRVSIIGHLQRGGSPTAFDRVLATRMGVYAVEALRGEETGKMVGIQGNTLVLRPLSDAWNERTQFDPNLMQVARMLSV